MKTTGVSNGAAPRRFPAGAVLLVGRNLVLLSSRFAWIWRSMLAGYVPGDAGERARHKEQHLGLVRRDDEAAGVGFPEDGCQGLDPVAQPVRLVQEDTDGLLRRRVGSARAHLLDGQLAWTDNCGGAGA